MSTQIVRKDLYELHKPSDLIACKYTVYSPNKKKSNEYYSLTPAQHDTMNYLCFNARRSFHKKYGMEELDRLNNTLSDIDFENFLRNERMDLDTDELAAFINAYTGSENRHNLMENVRRLTGVSVHTNYLQKGKMVSSTFPLITRIDSIEEENGKMKVQYRMEPEMILGYIYKTEKPFAKLMLKVQTNLKHTYSKILYEICKDYSNMKSEKITISKSLDQWVHTLNINPGSSYTKNVAGLKKAYLNKAIQEINVISDIFIDDISSKKKDGTTLMIVEFHNQESSLVESFDKAESEDINDDMLFEKMIDAKIRELALIELEEIKKLKISTNSKPIMSDKAYLDKLEKKFDRSEISAMLELDVWLEEEFRENDLNEYLLSLSMWLSKKENIIVTLKDYKLYDVNNLEFITKTIKETIEIINEFNNTI